MSSNPIFLLVPGSWHPAESYQRLLDQLHQLGYDTTAVNNPSSGLTQPETKTLENDAQNAREAIVNLIDQGRDVVVIAHSYGGLPGGAAAYGLSKKSRQQKGEAGGIIGLIFIAAFLLPEGPSLLGLLGGQHAPFVKLDEPYKGVSSVNDPVDVFYGDVESGYSKELVSKLRPQGQLVFDSPGPAPAWDDAGFQGRLAYIRTLQDKTVPTFVQDISLQGTNKDFIIVDMDTSHSPFASKPVETAQHIVNLLARFQS